MGLPQLAYVIVWILNALQRPRCWITGPQGDTIRRLWNIYGCGTVGGSEVMERGIALKGILGSWPLPLLHFASWLQDEKFCSIACAYQGVLHVQKQQSQLIMD